MQFFPTLVSAKILKEFDLKKDDRHHHLKKVYAFCITKTTKITYTLKL